MGDTLDRLAIILFGPLARRLGPRLVPERTLEEGLVYEAPTLIVARLLLHTVFTALGVFVALYSLWYNGLLRGPLLALAGLVAALLPVFIFLGKLLGIKNRASTRKQLVDHEFPFFAAYMTAMAYAGVGPERLIERLADLPVFRQLREEARRILRDVKVFGLDIYTAIERIAGRHPSKLFRDFMLGYLTTIRTGGDIRHYLETRTREVFNTRMEQLRVAAERVGLIVEAFVSISVLGTLSFYIFFVVSGMIGTGGFGFAGVGGIVMYTFLALPALVTVLLVMLDSMFPGFEGLRRPYLYLLVSLPLGFLVMYELAVFTHSGGVFLSLSGSRAQIRYASLAFGLGLAVIGVVPGLVYRGLAARERAVLANLTEFLRDLSEVRKTGLSPEKSIVMLSERDYGRLTAVIKKIASALSYGVQLEEATRQAIAGFRNWLLRVTMRFLVDAISYGGGSPETLDTLSSFLGDMLELVKTTRSKLKTYVFMPYMGALIVAASSIMIINMMGASIASLGHVGGIGAVGRGLSQATMTQLLAVVSLGSVFNAWLSGLVSGKVQDQSLASGLLHASLLAIVTSAIVFILL